MKIPEEACFYKISVFFDYSYIVAYAPSAFGNSQHFHLGLNSHMARVSHMSDEEIYAAGRVTAFSSFHLC